MPLWKTLLLLTPFLFPPFAHELFAQVEGLWVVQSVRVGDESMTPVAKWTRILPDHTYQAGNGWLQNDAGTWTFDISSSLFLPLSTDGLEDPFGPFAVSFREGEMLWERLEEGARVAVRWKPVEALPLATADRVTGLWALQGQDSDAETLFLRWDRIYVRTVDGVRRTGYWFLNAHRPELELIPHDDCTEGRKWTVTFGEDGMRWDGNSPENKSESLSFRRLQAFP